MNHYDLAKCFPNETVPEDWKQFLTDSEVQEWIKSEVSMIQDSELKKLVQGISESKSVGQAQVMNTLAKLNEIKVTKEGPTFIYTYVPLNSDESKANNTRQETKDVFKKNGT